MKCKLLAVCGLSYLLRLRWRRRSTGLRASVWRVCASMFLNLAKRLFDRVEIGAVGREKPKLGSGGFNRDFDGGALVSAEVVHDHDVAGAQRPDQFLFDVSCELLSVDRSIEDARRGQAVVAQARQGQGDGSFSNDRMARSRSAACRSHTGHSAASCSWTPRFHR